VRATCIERRSSTPTLLLLISAMISHRPSGVGAVPYAMPGSGTQRSSRFAAVSMTASRGSVWSAVKAHRSSTDSAIR
jgi:hypothetical protein